MATRKAKSHPTASLDPTPPLPVVWDGTPPCSEKVKRGATEEPCSRLSVPGDTRCYFHGGTVCYRPDGSLGYFGPGSFAVLSQLTGYSHNHLARAWSGKIRRLSLDFVRKLAIAIGCSEQELTEFLKRPIQVEDNFDLPEDTIRRVLEYKGKVSARTASAICGVSRMTVCNVWNSRVA